MGYQVPLHFKWPWPPLKFFLTSPNHWVAEIAYVISNKKMRFIIIFLTYVLDISENCYIHLAKKFTIIWNLFSHGLLFYPLVAESQGQGSMHQQKVIQRRCWTYGRQTYYRSTSWNTCYIWSNEQLVDIITRDLEYAFSTSSTNSCWDRMAILFACVLRLKVVAEASKCKNFEFVATFSGSNPREHY